MRRGQRHSEILRLVTGFQLSFMLAHHQIEQLPMRNPADPKVQTPRETAMESHQNRFGSHLWYKRQLYKGHGQTHLVAMCKMTFWMG